MQVLYIFKANDEFFNFCAKWETITINWDGGRALEFKARTLFSDICGDEVVNLIQLYKGLNLINNS